MLSNIKKHLRSFYTPDRESEPLRTLSVGSKSRNRPFLNALAGAGFASLALVTGAGDLYAQSQPEGLFSSLAPDSAESLSISSAETNSPDLGVFGMHVTNYLGLTAVVLNF